MRDGASIRLEDRGLTLRLFPTRGRAEQTTGATDTIAYDCGYLARDRHGLWMDVAGTLPADWAPQQERLPTQP